MNCEACGHENLEGARFCANCGITIITHQDSKDPRVGTVVGGRYRITGVIGEGGMGIVYAGEQQMGTAVRKVAVKTLHPELSRDPSVTARFHRECGTVAQLEHPNTIKVYDFGAMDDGTLYIAMEFLAGQSLDKVIEKEGALAPERVKRLLRQVAGSLDEAHRQGIVHRDLKPENVILVHRAGEADVVKLLDFGIAARTESADAAREAKLTQQGMVLGTPPYMSPEQFTGKALDRRSDIYSLGVMAYEMLTGKLPFEATTPWQWATEHMTSQPRPFETMAISTQIPKPMRDAILKALSKDREERFGTVMEFVDALDRAAPDSRSVVPGSDANVDTSTATAAMAAAPDFLLGANAGPAPTAAMPAQAAVAAGPGNRAFVPPAPVVGPTGAGGRAGNKGLVYGLVGAVVLLGGGIAIAVSRSGGDSTAPSTVVLTQTPPPVSIAPRDNTPDPQADDNSDDNAGQNNGTVTPPPIDKTHGGDKPNTGTTPPGKTTPPKNETPPPKNETNPPKNETPPPKNETGKSAACGECVTLAQGGQIVAAAAKYRQCSDAGEKKACSARARGRAPGEAKSAANRGDCANARAIQAAAKSMGAGSPGLDTAAASCK
jgi:serine/threonine-protein kinase